MRIGEAAGSSLAVSVQSLLDKVGSATRRDGKQGLVVTSSQLGPYQLGYRALGQASPIGGACIERCHAATLPSEYRLELGDRGTVLGCARGADAAPGTAREVKMRWPLLSVSSGNERLRAAVQCPIHLASPIQLRFPGRKAPRPARGRARQSAIPRMLRQSAISLCVRSDRRCFLKELKLAPAHVGARCRRARHPSSTAVRGGRL
jgi:hypothetical protein